MTSTIKPIETVYNGYRFRSRLEARWAVFFDALGVTYEYEKEGYDLGELGWYLPDFWLPEMDTFVEVKGQKPPADDEAKIKGLALSGTKVLLVGEIPHGEKLMGHHYQTNSYLPLQDLKTIAGRYCSFWDASYYGYPDQSEERPWQTTMYEGHKPYGSDNIDLLTGNFVFLQNKTTGGIGYYNTEVSWIFIGGRNDDWRDYNLSPNIDCAFDRARQARFEHGEKGVIR